MLPFLVTAALAGPPQRSETSHCFEQVEQVVFHCALDNGKWVSVCADAQSATPTFLQYRFGKKGSIELAKPDVTADNLTAWTRKAENLPRGENRTLAFANDGVTYTVFVTEAGPDTQAGLTVEKDGKVLATLTCANQTWTEHPERLPPSLGPS